MGWAVDVRDTIFHDVEVLVLPAGRFENRLQEVESQITRCGYIRCNEWGHSWTSRPFEALGRGCRKAKRYVHDGDRMLEHVDYKW